jgi:hypothetical protein
MEKEKVKLRRQFLEEMLNEHTLFRGLPKRNIRISNSELTGFEIFIFPDSGLSHLFLFFPIFKKTPIKY